MMQVRFLVLRHFSRNEDSFNLRVGYHGLPQGFADSSLYQLLVPLRAP